MKERQYGLLYIKSTSEERELCTIHTDETLYRVRRILCAFVISSGSRVITGRQKCRLPLVWLLFFPWLSVHKRLWTMFCPWPFVMWGNLFDFLWQKADAWFASTFCLFFCPGYQMYDFLPRFLPHLLSYGIYCPSMRCSTLSNIKGVFQLWVY